ncbi:Uncharacterised protein [uncultured archaeon]|nr:Uncharacterised protein [uncultured archaeon]
MTNPRVDLWSLPEDKIYVVLEYDVKCKLFASALKYSRRWSEFAISLGLPLNKWKASKTLESSRTKKISLRVLKLLLEYLERNGECIDRKLIERSVRALTSKRGSSHPGANCLFNPNLPFNFDTEAGAVVISALLHDGGINNRYHPHYSNLNVVLKRKVYNAFKEVFGGFDFKRADPEKCVQIYFPKSVGYILIHGFGMEKGRKVVNNPGIPRFVFNSSKEVRSAFLRQAFDDEAYVSKIGSSNRVISLKLASASPNPPKLLLDLQQLLLTFSIFSYGPRLSERYTSKDGVNATKWTIDILHQDNLIRFRNEIGFESTQKQERLERLVSSLKQEHFAKANKPAILIRACSRIQEEKGYITSASLGAVLNRSQALAKIEIRHLRRSGVLTASKERNGNKAAEYVITNDSGKGNVIGSAV